jgi:RNA polymerase subunit RPABC4/transcription elongation factor Spt4
MWETLAQIAIIIAVAYLLVLWVASLVWVYRDINSRTRDPISQAIALILVLVFNLPGLIIYLILRPKQTMMDQYDRQLEAEALLHEIQEQATCPSCRRRIDDDFIACPYCRTSLRTPCENCSRPLASTWVLCPYCASARVPVAVPPSSARDGDPTVAITRPPRAPRPASTAKYTPPAAAQATPATPETTSDAP